MKLGGGGGNHLSQTDMDDLEVRKVRALERIADALDGGKTSKYSGVTIESEDKPAAKKYYVYNTYRYQRI